MFQLLEGEGQSNLHFHLNKLDNSKIMELKCMQLNKSYRPVLMMQATFNAQLLG